MNRYLCPPGNGVFTVNTAKERKEAFWKQLYGSSLGVHEKWQADMEKLADSKVALLGIPSDCGGGILRGANWGPLFLRSELIKEDLKYHDLGDVRVIPHLLLDKYLNQETIESCRKALYQDGEFPLPVSPLSITEDFCNSYYATFSDKKLFSLGGDHSVSYPLTKSYLKAKKAQGKKVALIHFDAHTDLLEERMGIDICFGSWCTHILEDLLSPGHLIQIGIRSSGHERGHWENKFGVQQYWAEQVREEGPSKIADKIIAYLKQNTIDELYISYDIDALDASYASATGTPELNGLSPHESMIILQELAASFPFGGADLVEVAPFLATDLKGESPEPQTTLLSATTLIRFIISKMGED